MANKAILAKQREVTTQLKHMQDGWENVMTGLNMQWRDKKTGALPVEVRLSQTDIEALYQSSDIGSRIVDRPVEEMTREGFDLCIDGDDNREMADKMIEMWKVFRMDEHIENGLKWGRMYGGAGMFIGVSGQDPATPLSLAGVQSLSYFIVLDRYRLYPETTIVVSDIRDSNFGLPVYYNLMPDSASHDPGNYQKIHYSRVIRFDGVKLPNRMAMKNNFWGDSVYARLYGSIRNYESAHDSIATIVQDFTQLVFTMKGLEAILTQGKDELLMKRLALASRLGSIVNSLVMGEGESMDRKSPNVTGLADLIRLINNRLVSATDMPHTVLLGESAGGLGSTGESEKRDWYDHIKNKQESELRPILKKIFDLLFSQKSGPTRGQIPDYEIKFKPLWQLDEKDMLANRKTQAEIDEKYINLQVLTPEKIAISRFGGTEYSYETQLDEEEIKLLQNSPGPMIEETPPPEQDPALIEAPAGGQGQEGQNAS